MIYLIRHGQTALNKKRVLQGRSDQPLNDAGIHEAEEAGAEIIPTSFHVTGCCGKSIPAHAVKITYGREGKFVSLVMEKKANAERAKELILEKCRRS